MFLKSKINNIILLFNTTFGISVSSDMTGTVPSSDQSVAPPQPEASVMVNSSREVISLKNLCWREKR